MRAVGARYCLCLLNMMCPGRNRREVEGPGAYPADHDFHAHDGGPSLISSVIWVDPAIRAFAELATDARIGISGSFVCARVQISGNGLTSGAR